MTGSSGNAATSQFANFSLLLDLAGESSSDKRRDLLRQITDVFVSGEARQASECNLFDDIVGAVAPDMSVPERALIASKIADSSAPLRRTARRFASDDIVVATPVLERSKALTDDDLISIIKELSQEHLMAVTKRDKITSEVSNALVDFGHDPVVGSLLGNESATICRTSYEKITERAQTASTLRTALVHRKTSPLDLLNDIYMAADPAVRADIMRRMDSASHDELDTAIAIGESRRNAAGASPQSAEILMAKRWVEDAKKRGVFKPPLLVALLREKETVIFTVALAHFADVRPEVVTQVVQTGDIDALATLLKAADVDRDVFTSLATLLAGENATASDAQSYALIYEQVPPEAAQRALRFWKVRQRALPT